jgi:hypothetical protein
MSQHIQWERYLFAWAVAALMTLIGFVSGDTWFAYLGIAIGAFAALWLAVKLTIRRPR